MTLGAYAATLDVHDQRRSAPRTADNWSHTVKKFLPAIALSLAAALGLAACGSAPTDTGGTADFKACMVSDEGGFDDQSFNQSGMEGLERAKTELGVQINKAESKSDSDYQTNVDAMVQDGCNLIIGVGFKLATVLTDSAKAHPDIQFALAPARP